MPAIGEADGVNAFWVDLLLLDELFRDAPDKPDIVHVECTGAKGSHAAAIVEVAFIPVRIDDHQDDPPTRQLIV